MKTQHTERPVTRKSVGQKPRIGKFSTLLKWLYSLIADGNGTAYTYSPDGKLSTRTWARGITTTYSYDPASGSMTNVSYGQSLVDAPITYTYDRLGRQTSARTGTGDTHVALFAYDPSTLALTNETIIIEGKTNTITRTQDTLGRPSSIALSTPSDLPNPSYKSDYSYSSLGRFKSVQSAISADTNLWQYSYLPDSTLISTISNNISQVSHRSYEPNRDLITAIENRYSANMISKYQYSNDQLGRRTRRIDTTTGVTTNDFAYNDRSEITNALMGAESFGFDFDNIGNRETYTTNGTTFTYTANQLNQYTQITNGGLKTLTWDADGNMLTYNGWTYAWNGESRLSQATNSSTVVSFKYDYMGRRFEKVVDGVTNSFVYDGWNLVQETSGTNVTRYVWGLDLSGSMQGAGGIGGLLCVIENGTPYYPCFDANGNITEYVDENGTVVAHYEYSSFGKIIASSGSKKDDFHFRFSTKYYDAETGLYYYGYRYYSPEIGRWPSRDPIGEKGFEVLRSGYRHEHNTQSRKAAPSVRKSRFKEPGESRRWMKFIVQRAKEASNRFILRDPSRKPSYLFVDNNPINLFDILGLDHPGCDVPGLEGRFVPACYLECCARHDACFDNFDCTASSWWERVCRISQDPCDVCNADAAGCIAGCAAGEEDVDDPDEWNFYCAQCHVFFDDPNEHAGHGN